MKNQIQDKPYTFNAFTEYKVYPKSTTYDSVVCADSYGQMFIVVGSDQSWKTKLIYSSNLCATDITYEKSTSNIICAYENGDIYVMILKNDGNINIVQKLENPNTLQSLSLSTISMPIPLLVCSYINGEIKLFKLSEGYGLICSIGSSIRQISCIVTYMNYVIVCGEDGFINIWKVNNDLKINLVTSIEIPNRIPVGAVVIPSSENKISIVVSCYDYNSLVYLDNINL